MTKFFKFFNDNHWQAIAVAILLSAGFWFYGCQSKVASLSNSKLLVTRVELQGEIDAYLATAKARMTTLDQQDELRKKILDNAALFAQGGQMNPMGALSTVVSIFAIGSAVDSKRKVKALTKTKTV